MPTEQERREFFRFKNQVYISFELVDEPNGGTTAPCLSGPDSEQLHVFRELNAISDKNNEFLASLPKDQQETKYHVSHINRKIDNLRDRLYEALDFDSNQLNEVDLSGGGLRFRTSQSLTNGQNLRLELVLPPEFYAISACASVIECHKIKENEPSPEYEVAVSFTQISEPDRDLIIRQVLSAQSKELRGKSNPQ